MISWHICIIVIRKTTILEQVRIGVHDIIHRTIQIIVDVVVIIHVSRRSSNISQIIDIINTSCGARKNDIIIIIIISATNNIVTADLCVDDCECLCRRGLFLFAA